MNAPAKPCDLPALRACGDPWRRVVLAGARWQNGGGVVAPASCADLDALEVWIQAPAAWRVAGAVGLRVIASSAVGQFPIVDTTIDRVLVGDVGRIQLRGVVARGFDVELRQTSSVAPLITDPGFVSLRSWSSDGAPSAVSVVGDALGDAMHIGPIVSPVLALGSAYDPAANAGAGGWSRVRMRSGGVVVAPALAPALDVVSVAVGAVAVPLVGAPLLVNGPIALQVVGAQPVYVGPAGVTTANGFMLGAGTPGGGLVVGVADASSIYAIAPGPGSELRAFLPLS